MLSNKIHAPRPRDDLLVRPRLLDALAAEAAPYVLVTGPAGSGKTVLVRQWLDRLDQPAAWFTIDPRDNDPARFWTYFTGAVSTACPEFGWSLEGPLTAESVEALTVSLADVAPLVLVLDDLHFLVEGQVLEQLGQLVDALPVQVRLVLVSRALPELRLARHRALGAMVEVHGHDLLFTEEETARVLRRQGQDPLTAAVFDSTRGWPVAVAFAASLPDPAPGAAHQRPTARSRQQIADYLTEEVLRAQPAPVQEFLLDTSVLDEISVKVATPSAAPRTLRRTCTTWSATTSSSRSWTAERRRPGGTTRWSATTSGRRSSELRPAAGHTCTGRPRSCTPSTISRRPSRLR